jgi:heterodisulfide reductase subunit B
MELSFYPGCTGHSTAWEFITSTRAVFSELGHKLVDIEDWNCCGGASGRTSAPVVGVGLPARNLLIAQKEERTLLAPCAGCYNNTRRALSAFEEGGDAGRELEEVLGEKWKGAIDVWSLVEFFERPEALEEIEVKVKKPLEGLKIVAYYGCQLVRPRKVTGALDCENPTVLEKACEAAGATSLDWSYKVDCCGADMGISHGGHAGDICSRLGEAAREAGADAIVVSCGLCHANMDMRQGKEGLPVIYITELLGEAFQLPGRDKWWKKHLIDPSGLFK